MSCPCFEITWPNLVDIGLPLDNINVNLLLITEVEFVCVHLIVATLWTCYGAVQIVILLLLLLLLLFFFFTRGSKDPGG